MKKDIPMHRIEGVTSRQAHADFPDGTYERELGREGFFGPVSHMYHTHPLTNWSAWDGPLRPRAVDMNLMPETETVSPWDAPIIMDNNATEVRIWRYNGKMENLVRNADGDQLLFIHEGAGHLYCDYGHMEFRDGDYLVIPRGTLWRIETTEAVFALLIQATNSAYQLPDRGLVGPNAIFDPAILGIPTMDEAFKDQQGEKETQIMIKRHNRTSTVTFPYNPLDAIGWKGDLAPVKLNWRDIRPLMSHRYHLPPSAHTTFLSNRFVVCTFVPRPIESDPGALKVPFYHNNDDFDEIIFYHRGEFFSRDNIHPGMMTIHPSGFTHGPHPKAFAAGAKHAKKETDEVAVMIDTRDYINVPEAYPQDVEWHDYVNSWKP